MHKHTVCRHKTDIKKKQAEDKKKNSTNERRPKNECRNHRQTLNPELEIGDPVESNQSQLHVRPLGGPA